jgi:hypothetical protein
MLVAGALVPACARRATALPVQAVHDGISIAVYASPAGAADDPGGVGYALIDDRRWIDVDGDAIVLDRIAPEVALESLVIEPLAGGSLVIGACLRAWVGRDPADDGAPAADHGPVLAPMLRCAVHARRGRYLVRVLYVSHALGYRAQHDVAMTAPDRATVVSRFAIATPPWHTRGNVAVWSGLPGTEHPPRELARGAVMLDGSTAVIAVPPRVISAELRWVYEGAARAADGSDPRERQWRHDSHPAVWVWLELRDARTESLAGAVHAHVEPPGEPARDIDVPPLARRTIAAGLGLPLWIDPQLHGRRDLRTDSPDDGALTDRFALSVANTGSVPRDVWIEEPLRPVRRRSIVHAWPSEPSVVSRSSLGDARGASRESLRLKLTVPAGKLAHGGFEIRYEL